MIKNNFNLLLKVTEDEKYFFLNLNFLLKVGQIEMCQNPSFISTIFFQPNSAEKRDFRCKMISPSFSPQFPTKHPQGNEFPIPQKSRITNHPPPSPSNDQWPKFEFHPPSQFFYHLPHSKRLSTFAQ